MKKRGLLAFLIVFVIVLTLGLTACAPETTSVAVTDIDVEKSIELKVGAKKTLSPIVIPYNASDKTLKYSSTNIDVATVNQNGEVNAVGAGNCEIVIKAVNDYEKRVSVSVYESVSGVTVVSVATSDVLVKTTNAENSYVFFTKKSDTYHTPITTKITAKVLPEGAKQDLVYESSNKTLASVDENGVVSFANIPTATVGTKNVEIKVRSKDDKEIFQVLRFEIQYYDNTRFDLVVADKNKQKFENNVLTTFTKDVTLRTKSSVTLTSNSDPSVVFNPSFTITYESPNGKENIPVKYYGYQLELKLPPLPTSGFNGQVTITIKEAKTQLEIKHTFIIKYLQ